MVLIVTVLRSSSSVAVRNGSTFFFSMVTLRMRTGVSVRPSAPTGAWEMRSTTSMPFGHAPEGGELAVHGGLRKEANEELRAIAIGLIGNSNGRNDAALVL